MPRFPALSRSQRISRFPDPALAVLVAALLVILVAGCNSADSRSTSSPPVAAAPAAERPAPTRVSEATSRELARDLSLDEAAGGHTLARHIGRTDAELQDRLRREPHISSASTYTDRATAQRVVGAALASGEAQLRAWQNRSGRRPNLVLHYVDRTNAPIGRSLARGRSAAVPCDRAIVVLRWNEQSNRFYVLTSYPEAER